jgi:hypothetical protein
MSFSAEWLSLREPFDADARDCGLADRLAGWAAGKLRLQVVDLGSGSGSNLRWLAPRLPPAQEWRLIEHDPRLIAAGSERLRDGPRWRYVEADLETDLEGLLEPPPDLVTASALIDIVSEAWLARLAAAVVERGAALLVVLSFDGRISFDPVHLMDRSLVELVHRHQRSDKGFGPALGPAAAGALASHLQGLGRQVEEASSDWRLGAADRAIQAALIGGYAEVATEIAPERRAEIGSWRQARLALVEAGKSELTVGHLDLLSLP